MRRKEKGICVNKHGKRRCECECECGVISDLHDSQEFCHKAHTQREGGRGRGLSGMQDKGNREFGKSRNRYFIKIPNVAQAASLMSNSLTACLCLCLSYSMSMCVCVCAATAPRSPSYCAAYSIVDR